MKRLLLSIAMLATFCTGAFAADLTAAIRNGYSAQPVAVYNWQGVYAGLTGGGAWGHIDTTANSITTSGALVGIPGGKFNPAATFRGADSSASLSGGAFGGFAGYNYQLGRLVLGVEGDFAGTTLKTASAFAGSPAGPQYTTSTKADMYGTFRARAGYAFDNVLVYGTGGLAVGHFRSTLGILPGPAGAPTGPQYAASSDAWKVGYAVGAGFDWQVAPHWIVGFQYLHMGFGKSGYDFDFGKAGSAHADGKFDVDLAMARVGYQF